MSKETKKTRTPKLRFAEFREAGEWGEKTIGFFFDFDKKPTKAESFDKEKILTVKLHTQGVVKNERATLLTGGTNYFKRRSGEFIFSKIDLLNGAFGIVPNELDGFVSSTDVPAFSFKENCAPTFFINWLRYSYSKLQVERTGTSNTLKRVAPENFFNLKVFVPIDVNEQQKIAAFLSSLDDLITAQREKIKTLQVHKKGLMQQIFPAEGETVPRVRFGEFRNSGDWEEKTLGDAGTFINGKAYKQEELLEAGKYRVLRVGNFFTNNHWYYSNLELEENKYCDDGDLLYAWSASFGPRIWNGEKVIYHYHIWKVIEKKGIDKKFLFLLLDYETEEIKAQQANGLGLLHITKGTIEGWKCHIPRQKEEQQKIADCLRSLDDLITAQSQKLEVLKAQKKGLMQGLFPNPNET